MYLIALVIVCFFDYNHATLRCMCWRGIMRAGFGQDLFVVFQEVDTTKYRWVLWLERLRGRPRLSIVCFSNFLYESWIHMHHSKLSKHVKWKRDSCLYWKGSVEKGWKCLALSRFHILWADIFHVCSYYKNTIKRYFDRLLKDWNILIDCLIHDKCRDLRCFI